MSILFASAIDFNSNTSFGISSKVLSQARAAEEAGHDVMISRDFGAETRIERPLSGEVIAAHAWSRIRPRRDKYAFLRDWILSNGIEAVIVRFDHLDGVFSGFAKSVRARGVIVAVEFPTFPFDRERDARHQRLLDSRRYTSYFAHRVFASLEAGKAHHATEYIDYTVSYLENRTIWGVPNITYDNGIDFSSIPLRRIRVSDDIVRMLAVAKFAPHHGIDRLIRGISEYRGTRIVHLTLVGIGAESTALEALVSECGLEDVVEFAGVAVGDDLDEFFDRCDVAVGSLGLHRIGISLGSTMKSREYCARGIPFIYSFPEKGFDGTEEFTMLMPSTDEAIDVGKVISFVDEMTSKPEIPAKMRRFAEERFDWRVQMDKVLTVLETEVESRANG